MKSTNCLTLLSTYYLCNCFFVPGSFLLSFKFYWNLVNRNFHSFVKIYLKSITIEIYATNLIPQLLAKLSSLRFSDFSKVSKLWTRSQVFHNPQTNHTYKNIAPRVFLPTLTFSSDISICIKVLLCFILCLWYNKKWYNSTIEIQQLVLDSAHSATTHYLINTKESG